MSNYVYFYPPLNYSIMYTITSDFQNFIFLENKSEAILLANSIQGGVYISSNGEMVCIHSYKD